MMILRQSVDSVRLCGELLYGSGNAEAYCAQVWGIEHSHDDDLDAMVADGRAARLDSDRIQYDATVLIMGGEVAQVNLTVYRPVQVAVYATNPDTGMIHLTTERRLMVDTPPETLCGIPFTDWETGDESVSGIASDCEACKRALYDSFPARRAGRTI